MDYETKVDRECGVYPQGPGPYVDPMKLNPRWRSRLTWRHGYPVITQELLRDMGACTIPFAFMQMETISDTGKRRGVLFNASNLQDYERRGSGNAHWLVHRLLDLERPELNALCERYSAGSIDADQLLQSLRPDVVEPKLASGASLVDIHTKAIAEARDKLAEAVTKAKRAGLRVYAINGWLKKVDDQTIEGGTFRVVYEESRSA